MIYSNKLEQCHNYCRGVNVADQERKVYDFKSVGITEESRQNRNKNRGIDTPIGIMTPIRLSTSHSDLFEMHTDLSKQIRDNFRNMLTTNHGDRIMLYDFGANLLSLAFDLGTEDIDTEAQRRISRSTEKYMPYINLETFETFSKPSEDGSLAQIGVSVTYSVPSLRVFNQRVEALIYAAG